MLQFYKDGNPVRLLVANEGTDIDACIKKALEQTVFDIPLSVLLQNIKTSSVDLERNIFIMEQIMIKK